MKEESITFAAGPITLEGLLSLPEPACSRGVVLCHPHPLYGGEMGNNVVSALARAMQDAGMATLRFNFRGVGRSQGQHGGGETEVQDVDAAITTLLDRTSLGSAAVAGYSFGALVGLRAGAHNPHVNALIGIALPLGVGDTAFLTTAAKPTLLVSGDCDTYSPLAGLEALSASSSEPTELVTVHGADHFLVGRESEVVEAAIRFLEACG